MLTRIITGVVGIPIAIWILARGGIIMQGCGVVLALIAMDEYFKAVGKAYNPMRAVGMISVGVFILGYQTCAANYQLYLAIVILLMLVVNVCCKCFLSLEHLHDCELIVISLRTS